MATLCLQQEEMLAEKVQGFPFLYNKRVTGFKDFDDVENTLQKVAESLDFAEIGLEGSCSKKIGVLFCIQNSFKIIGSQFDF